jgi:hypothetical protein
MDRVMGTNYSFVNTDIHIGKRVSLGQDNGCSFIFAISIDPAHFERPYPYTPGLADVIDEYGNTQTWASFLDLIYKDNFDWRYIGTSFS